MNTPHQLMRRALTHNLLVDIRHAACAASMAGGALWAVANSFATGFAPIFPGWPAVFRSAAEGACALVAAAIGGWFVAPGLCAACHVTDVEIVSIFGLGVGLISWPITPKIVSALQALALARINITKLGAP